MTAQKIIFRADGSGKIGFGHISRCLALAEILPEEFTIYFAVQAPGSDLISNLKRVVDEVIILNSCEATSPAFLTELLPHLTGQEIVVLDGYHFDSEYEKSIKAKAVATISIDDIPNRHFISEVVFNFCGSLGPKDYSKEFYTQVFTGFDYLFLRSPFLRNQTGTKRFNKRLFLNMGGGDFGNETLRVLNELHEQNFSGEIEIVVGNSYSYLSELKSAASGGTVTIYQGLSPEEMFDCMSRCAVAIVPPSTVALEFLSTGGVIFLHQTAGNQMLLKKYLLDEVVAFDYAGFRSTLITEALFQECITAQNQKVNNRSEARIQKLFKELALACQLTLRNATHNDKERCFEWANDPEARRQSYTTNQIEWNDHVTWFDRKMTDLNCHYFIGEIAGQSVGQIRFDFLQEKDAFQISYSLDRKWRGQGLSHYLLTKGVQKLFSTTTNKSVIGYVQKQNVASIRAFQKAGFATKSSETYPDSFKFVLS